MLQRWRGQAAVAALAAACCVAAVALGGSSRMLGGPIELLPAHGAGGGIASEVGEYSNAWRQARDAVGSVASGITAGIFTPKASHAIAVPSAPVEAAADSATTSAESSSSAAASSEPVDASAATESSSSSSAAPKARAQPAAKRAQSVLSAEAAARVPPRRAISGAGDADTAPGAEAVGRKMGSKDAVDDINRFFDAMQTTTAKRARPVLRAEAAARAPPASVSATSGAGVGADPDTSPMAESVGHKMGAKTAVNDINGYFDAMPTTNVNAFHEPAKLARSLGRRYDGEKSRAELDDYFNRLAKDVHHEEYRARDAVKDLTSYYAELPVKDVTADHNPAAKKPTIKDFQASEAVKDIADYFDKIPVKKVNPFHEAAHGEHKPTLPKYSADSAVKELDDYYSDLPVKSVNAFHQKRENLAKEERAASAGKISENPNVLVL